MSKTDSSKSIGSLVIDLRANTAQLRVDMAQVKDTVQKTSRELSAQMKEDFTETKRTLALLSAEGFGIPRELRGVIASSDMARTAILGMRNALVAFSLINLGLEAFNKISGYLAESAKKSEEEAKHTRDIVDAAQKAVDATFQRREQLALIGKGEEDRAALQKKFFADEITRDGIRLKTLQAQIAAKLALVNLDAARAASPDVVDDMGNVVGKGSDEAAGDKVRQEGLEALNKATEETRKQIGELQKAIDAAIAGTKENDVRLADFQRNLGLERIANEKNVALARLSLEQSTAQALMNLHGADLAADFKAEEDAAEQRYNVELNALNRSIAILQQDPSRNKEKIQKDLSEIQVLWYTHQQEMVKIYAENTAKITAINDKWFGELLVMGQPIGKSGVEQGAADFEAMTKRDAELGKVRKDAMDALLTPTEKYQQELALIQAAMVGWEKFPNVMKALTTETLRLNPEFQKLQQASAEFGHDLANELDQLIVKGESFSDFLKNIAKDIEEIALKALLLKPLEDFFSGGKSGTGGIFGSLAHLFSGLGFAGGGSPPVGQLSLVGENGPELFMPSSAGTIIPNGALGGDTYYISIDARNAAPGSEAAIMRGMQQVLEKNRQASIAGAVDYQRRR